MFELFDNNSVHCLLYIESNIVGYIDGSEIVLPLIHMILLFIGVTLIAASYCKLPKIKQQINNVTDDKKYALSDNTAERLKGYHNLLNQGIITQEEYEKKKDELLRNHHSV